MTEHVWLNGRIVPASKATIPLLDRAVQIGFGLFEVIRAYHGRPFRLQDHIDRMRRSAKHFGLAPRVTDAKIHDGVDALLERNRLKEDAYVRLVATAGAPGVAPSFLIRAIPYHPRPASDYRRGVAVTVSPWRRDPRAPLYGHKTLNYLENVLSLERAQHAAFADMLHLDMRGNLLEGCVTNLFFVRGGVLRTPALGSILPGVTRQIVIGLARSLRIPVHEGLCSPPSLHAAEEAFLTNALIEVLPVTRVEQRRLGGAGDVTKLLAAAYRASTGSAGSGSSRASSNSRRRN